MSTRPGYKVGAVVPEWVPHAVLAYLEHVEKGRSIRSIAREKGCHASTISRQVRRFETRRDDLLVDLALRRLGEKVSDGQVNGVGEANNMQLSEQSKNENFHIPDDAELRRVAPRILRRMNEVGACMAIARDMENAVVARETSDGRTLRTAVVDRHIAEAMALNDWISVIGEGRITRYRITTAGRLALKRFLAEDEDMRAGGDGETGNPYSEQHREWETRETKVANSRRGIRYNATESPLSTLARRRDKNGNPFLSPDLVAAGERLREDFELAQMGPRVTQNWDKFLTGGTGGQPASVSGGGGSDRARDRVMTALRDLGPGLGDVVLRCCCFLEGMEAIEKRMGWSARSGKIVLRIALIRLKAHYDEENGSWSPLIG